MCLDSNASLHLRHIIISYVQKHDTCAAFPSACLKSFALQQKHHFSAHLSTRLLLLQLDNRKIFDAVYINIPPGCSWGTGSVQFCSVIEGRVHQYFSANGLPLLQPDECIRFWKLSSSAALHSLSAEQKRPGEPVYMCKWSPYLTDPEHASYPHLLAMYDDGSLKPAQFFNEHSVIVCQRCAKSGMPARGF